MFSCSIKFDYTLFFIRMSNLGAEAERSYFFCDLSLKTFLGADHSTSEGGGGGG